MFQIYAGESLVYEPGDSELVLLTPKLTLEMGKAGSLEFTVPAGHPYTDILKQLTKPVAVDLDGERIFRGRILSGSRTFYNQREIYCEGVLSYLVDSVQKAVKYDGKTHALFRQIIANHNARMPAEKQFTVGNITVPDQDIHLLGQSDDISRYDYSQIAINSIVDNWNTTYDYIETCLISYCGGYLVVRQENDINYIDWVSDYTDTATQEIVFGENLLDLTDETTAEDIFTVLIPLGDDNLTVKSVNQGSDEIVDEAKVAKYGRIVKTNVFSNVTKAQTLLENGRRYLADNGDVPTTLTITAIDLHSVYPEIEAIHLGDRVYIRSDPHELSQYLTCTKIEYDLEKPENTVYTFGREKQTLTKRYREDKRAKNDTYGNGANGDGSGIGAAAADEAGGWHWLDDNISAETNEKIEGLEEKVDDKFTNFYDEWIDFDPEHPDGKISLGALAEMYIGKDGAQGEDGDRYKLINNVGIDLDSPSGQISLTTTAEVANQANATANDASGKTASIILWAGGDPSDGTLGSNIALNADLVEVSNRLKAVEGIFDRISSDTAYMHSYLDAPAIYADHYFINATQGDSIDLAGHYHNIYEAETGGLVIGPPISMEDRVPFDITNTQEYQDGVLAVVLDDLVGTSFSSDDGLLSGTVPLKDNTSYAGNMIFGCLITTLTNDNTKTIRVGLNAEKPYNAGWDYGATTSVVNTVTVGSAGTPEYNSSNKHWESNVSVIGTGYALDSNSNHIASKAYSGTKTINVTNAYNAGWDYGATTAVVNTITVGSAGTPTYNSDNKHWESNVSVIGTGYALDSGSNHVASQAYSGTKTINVTSVYNTVAANTEERSVTYTTNGLRTVTVNKGKVGMTSVSINVNVPKSTPKYAVFTVKAISASGGGSVYIYSDETGLMRLSVGDTFDQT